MYKMVSEARPTSEERRGRRVKNEWNGKKNKEKAYVSSNVGELKNKNYKN